MEKIKIHFWGASKTVTGSKYLIESTHFKVLIDCGLFQGLKEGRLQNWADLPFDVASIDAVILTHGHLDHTGYLPRLLQQKYTGPIWATPPTSSITEIILRDSAKIHEEEAERANKEGLSKHHPAKPLYTTLDVEKTLRLFRVADLDLWTDLAEGIRFRFRFNGHILGATFIELEFLGKRFVFSGDIGREEDLLLRSPEKPVKADYLFLESTYGDRLHPTESVEDRLISLVNETIEDGGMLVIPTFAVERLQTILYLLSTLRETAQIPDVPIVIDSPMGNRILSVFDRFPEWHKLETPKWKALFENVQIITSYGETWKIIDDPQPKIVVAGSGMVTGGRVLTYLQQWLRKPTTRVLLVGYMAEGTRGRQLLNGAHEIRIRKKYYPVKAQVHHIESLSAHADQEGLINWCSAIENQPDRVFLTHGEPTASDSLRVKLKDIYGWNAYIPQPLEIIELP